MNELRMIMPGNRAESVAYTGGEFRKKNGEVIKSIWVGTSGNIIVHDASGAAITFTNVPVGFFDFSASAIIETGTTATGLVAIYWS